MHCHIWSHCYGSNVENKSVTPNLSLSVSVTHTHTLQIDCTTNLSLSLHHLWAGHVLDVLTEPGWTHPNLSLPFSYTHTAHTKRSQLASPSAATGKFFFFSYCLIYTVNPFFHYYFFLIFKISHLFQKNMCTLLEPVFQNLTGRVGGLDWVARAKSSPTYTFPNCLGAFT